MSNVKSLTVDMKHNISTVLASITTRYMCNKYVSILVCVGIAIFLKINL